MLCLATMLGLLAFTSHVSAVLPPSTPKTPTITMAPSNTVTAGINLDVVFAKLPLYKSSGKIPPNTVNRTAIAVSITNQLKQELPTTTKIARSKTNTIHATSVLSKLSKTKASIERTSTTKASAKPAATKQASHEEASTKEAATKNASTRKVTSIMNFSSSTTGYSKPGHKIHSKESSGPPIRAGKTLTERSESSVPKLSGRSLCTPQTILYNYYPANNTPIGFLMDSTMATLGNSLNNPPGYTMSFYGAFGSVNANQYIGMTALPSYNPTLCQIICDGSPGCNSFNIFFERDPTLDPGPSCPNPTSAASVICTLWGDTTLSPSQAVNVGQWRTNFMVVIQGSAAFVKNLPPPLVSGYANPVTLAGAINPAAGSNAASMISSSFTVGSTFNASICTTLCTNYTATNRNSAILRGAAAYSVCNYVNAFQLGYNGSVLGTYCLLSSSSTVNSTAPLYNTGPYTISNSVGYAVNNPSTGTNTLSVPFYMQAMRSTNTKVNGLYIAMAPASGGDVGIFVSNITSATKFVIDSSSSQLIEWSNNPGYFVSLPPANPSVPGRFFAGPTVPSNDMVALCFDDTSNNWIACANPGYFDAVTCNTDGFLYWMMTGTEPSACQWLALTPIQVAS